MRNKEVTEIENEYQRIFFLTVSELERHKEGFDVVNFFKILENYRFVSEADDLKKNVTYF